MPKSTFHCCLYVAMVSVFVFCYGGTSAFAAEQGEISWQSYKEGLARAKAENKKVFLHFYTNKCHYCRVMQKETFVDKNVINLLNDKFVSVKVNLSKDSSLGTKYPAPGVPMSWFLEGSGGKIGGRPGYLPPDQFINMLQYILNEEYKKEKQPSAN